MSRRGSPPAVSLAEVRARLLHAAALHRPFPEGPAGARALLDAVGCIQLDPIDRIGTNAELVAFARVAGLRRGELHPALAGGVFEHFAKERCLLHPRYFPIYRTRAAERGWWRNEERWTRVDRGLVDDVLAELRERGPATPDALGDRGRAEPMDWSGWKGTASRTGLALEVLWTTCTVVAVGRDGRGRRIYDVPERALGEWAQAPPPEDPAGTLVVERVRSAGLLARAGGPTWAMLDRERRDGTVDRLLAEGRLREVTVEGAGRPYLALPEDPPPPDDEAPMRVLGPLDALLWDRGLVRRAFGFDYVWEVYKPAPRRRWGWYVCPLLDGARLVGRVEARREGTTLVVDRTWEEAPRAIDPARLDATLADLADRNRCDQVRRHDR